MATGLPKSPASNEERLHDADEWINEAKAVIADVKDCVAEFTISEELKESDECVFLNLTTLEQQQYTIELSAAGFRIIGTQHNKRDSVSNQYYETPYSLLDNISPLYRSHFCSALSAKLEALQNSQ